MRAIFMGSPNFAIPVLQAVLDLDLELVGVYTQPDKPAGRGRNPEQTPIKTFAQNVDLRIFQPTSFRGMEVRHELADLKPDVVVVAAYGKLLPAEVLGIPQHGYLNVHPSLLPRFRGPSPVVSAILEDEEHMGTTVILLDEGLDTGAILTARELPGRIPAATAETLTEDLFDLGGKLISEILPKWIGGQVRPHPQDDSLATVTRKLERGDGIADWTMAATALERRCRAYTPWPSLHTSWKGKMLKILSAIVVTDPEPDKRNRTPGLVVPGNPPELSVVTGEGTLVVTTVQLEGKKAVSAGEFLRGYPDFLGSVLPS